MNFTKEQLEKYITDKGFKWYKNELNIIGIRNSATGNVVTNKFDDWMTVTRRVGEDKWEVKVWPITTEPGKKGVEQFHNAKGVARLIPGQYIHSWAFGLHQGKYEALKQCAPVKVMRDADKDLVFDGTKTDEGIFGINIHKAGADSENVENWSEGCMVFKREKDFNEFMKICKENGASKFTYTLVESKDLA